MLQLAFALLSKEARERGARRPCIIWDTFANSNFGGCVWTRRMASHATSDFYIHWYKYSPVFIDTIFIKFYYFDGRFQTCS